MEKTRPCNVAKAHKMKRRLGILRTGLDYYVELLNMGKPFSFVRYGNGEWDGILGTHGGTRSGSQNLRVPGIRRDLQNSLKHTYDSRRYLLGMQNYMQRRPIWPGAMQWLKVNAPDLVWHNGDVFHWASSGGKLWPLIQELRKKPLVFIGPSHLRPISKLLPYKGFVEVRLPNCYQDKAKIHQAILKQKAPTVFCFSAGPTAKILISELFPLLGKENFLIDFGSLWDVYCGVKSRSYHKKITPAIIRKNFR